MLITIDSTRAHAVCCAVTECIIWTPPTFIRYDFERIAYYLYNNRPGENTDFATFLCAIGMQGGGVKYHMTCIYVFFVAYIYTRVQRFA